MAARCSGKQCWNGPQSLFDTIAAMRALVTALYLVLFGAAAMQASDGTLQIYFVDVEGGQSTLFVPSHGQSLLVDTGWGYNAFRDANRIVAAAKMAKINKIDYVLITHFHSDHVGGVPQLADKSADRDVCRSWRESRDIESLAAHFTRNTRPRSEARIIS